MHSGGSAGPAGDAAPQERRRLPELPAGPETGELGNVPDHPMAYWGRGSVPDQHGRGWADDDGDRTPPPDPGVESLPAARPWWGPHRRD